ncbi:MAG: TraB/GumN family protein [Bacteroidales bacterium]|nr:TraB/GumN family protein [Bacteroidales bacterium]
MKKLLLSFLLAFFVTLSFSQSLLWKVTGGDLKEPSYLYGSIHIQDARVFAFDSVVVLGTLQSCDAFAMEILMDEIDPKAIKHSQYMKKGKMLSKMMKPADFAKLDSVCKVKLGASAYFVNSIKPFFLSSALQQADMAKDKEDALDVYFLKKARAAGKKCYGVEQYQDQIAAIDAISLKDQIKMLVESLDDNEADSNSAQSQFDELLEAYLTYNFDKMLELSADESLPKKFNKVFLIDRNVGMADHFAEIARTQSLFCVVGAAHLAGEKGVPALLRKKGYTVEPVLFQFHAVE